MRNSNNRKLNRKVISNILYESKQGYFYSLWKYDIESLSFDRKKSQARYNSKYLGNEIFACCLIAAILAINIGGSVLIRNNTKEQSIYKVTPQESSAASRK